MERYVVLFTNCLGEREVPRQEAEFWAAIGLFVSVLKFDGKIWQMKEFLFVTKPDF
jgi:hypothetical protein